MVDTKLIPAAVVGGLLAVGLIGAGALIGQGVVNARVGDRSVTVRGLAERDVQADLAVLPLRFTASGVVLSEVQSRIDERRGRTPLASACRLLALAWAGGDRSFAEQESSD